MVVVAALVLRGVITRGKGLVEGALALLAGLASAVVGGLIAHLGSGAPDMFGLATVFSTKESWVAAVAVFSALFGDRMVMWALAGSDGTSAEARVWLERWFPWMKSGGDK